MNYIVVVDDGGVDRRKVLRAKYSDKQNPADFQGNPMHIVALVVLAWVLGWIHSYLQPKLANVLPATWSQNAFGRSFFTGAFILISFFVATFIVGMLFKGKKVV
jgi:hypothetical protein